MKNLSSRDERVFSILVLVMLSSACTQYGSKTATTPKTEVELTGETKKFEMTAKKFEFVPSTIIVNRGDVVQLHITSTDVTHGFALSDFGINERLEPGERVTVEFVASKVGTFTFSCSVFCGPGHGGMKGQLIVK